MVWKRPKNVPFPQVWHRFTGKVKVNGKPLEYKVQDLTDDLVEPCIEHLVRYFLTREALTAHEGFSEDEVSKEELIDLWREFFTQRVSLVAIVEGEGPESKRIAGLNILTVSGKDDPQKDYEGKGMKKLKVAIEFLYKREDLFDKYKVDYYLNGMGLSVAAHYQGDGVGYQILKARDPMCKALGIKLAITGFSNPAALHEALKAGYQLLQDTTVDKIIMDGEPMFPRLKDRIFVLTSKVIE